MDWSWQLLSEESQQALSALTAFPTSFTIGDAEAVVVPDSPGSEVVDLVQDLWEKSLLRALPDRDGRRFDLLRTVRDFAESRGGDLSACWVRHAEWVASRVCAPAEIQLLDHNRALFEDLSAYHDDLRVAITRLLALGRHPILLAQLVIAAHATWHRSGPTSAYFELVERALDPRLPGPVQARLHLVAVHMSVRSGRHPPGPGPDWPAILALVDNDPSLRCYALLLQAALLGSRGQVDDASAILDQVADLLSGQPPGPLHVRLELLASSVAADRGRLELARTIGLRGLSLCERAGVPSQETFFFLNLGLIEGRRGNHEGQARESRRALLRAREVGDPRFERLSLNSLGNAEAELGALDRSARHLADALALCIQAHDESLAHHTLMDLVEIDFARGELDEALRHLWRARHQFPLPHPTWAPARLDAWDAMVSWARWGSAAAARDTLAAAAATLRSGSASMPHAAVYFDAKVLAARAYLEDDATDELSRAFDLLEAEAAEAGRADQLRALALDRAHLRLARAFRASARGEDVSADVSSVAAMLQADKASPWSPGGLGAACCRVLLAGVMAEAEHGRLSEIAGVRGEAG